MKILGFCNKLVNFIYLDTWTKSFPGTHLLIPQGTPLFLITQFGNADLTLERERESARACAQQSSFFISSPVFGNGFWHFPNVSLVSDMLPKSLLLRVASRRTDSHTVQSGRGVSISSPASPRPAWAQGRPGNWQRSVALGPFCITFFFLGPNNTNSFNFSSVYFLIFSSLFLLYSA